MRRQIVVTRSLRVGIIAVASNDQLLSNVGLTAWEASGALRVEQSLPEEAFTVIRPLIVHGGKRAEVEKVIKDWCDAPNKDMRCDLILTIGGDGPAPRDVMPDSVRGAIVRDMPGLAEHLRRNSRSSSENGAIANVIPAPLSRAIAGIRGQTLIVNLPSSYANPADAVRVLLPLLPEALSLIGVQAFEEITPIVQEESASLRMAASVQTLPLEK